MEVNGESNSLVFFAAVAVLLIVAGFAYAEYDKDLVVGACAACVLPFRLLIRAAGIYC
jgi:hypothetical protein